MKHTRILTCLAAIIFATLVATVAAGEFVGEILANSDVVRLVKADVPADVVVAKIQSTPNIFDLSTSSLLSLKENGVPDAVIKAMMAAASGGPAGNAMDSSRFRSELENIASGVPEARTAGLAWMVANRDQSLEPLRQALGDSRSEIRSAALLALSGMGDKGSFPAIRNLLRDPTPSVRQATANALVSLDDTGAITAAESAVSQQHPAPLDGYIRIVGFARRTQSTEALAKILEHNAEKANRVAAAWSLGEIGRAAMAGRPALENALSRDPEPEVRREAAMAIAKFHDSKSAELLQNACAKDPDVRKVTLAAMAEYPETASFLIEVMQFGPEKIAADELELARASLMHLTGQDFGMDGTRWREWFDTNRSRFPASVSMSPTSDAPLPSIAGQSRPHTPEVDVEAWSIVADSAGIPMAPQVDDGLPPAPSAGSSSIGAPSVGAPGIPAPSAGLGIFGPSPSASGAGTLSAGSRPSASSSLPDGTAAVLSPAGVRSEFAVPTDIPDDMLFDDLGFDESPSTVFRTWSSAPERIESPAGRVAAQAPEFADDPRQGPGGIAGVTAPAPTLPTTSVVAPFNPAEMTSPISTESLGGISLPLPPMDGDDSPAAPPIFGDYSGETASSPSLSAPATTFPGSQSVSGSLRPSAPSPSESVPSPFAGGDEYGDAFESVDAGTGAGSSGWRELTPQTESLPADGAETLYGGFEGIEDGIAEMYGIPTSDEQSGSGDDMPALGGIHPPSDYGESQAQMESGGFISSPDTGESTAFSPEFPASPSMPMGMEQGAEGGDQGYSIFVEPEPGQHVIGEPLTAPVEAATGMPDYEYTMPTDAAETAADMPAAPDGAVAIEDPYAGMYGLDSTTETPSDSADFGGAAPTGAAAGFEAGYGDAEQGDAATSYDSPSSQSTVDAGIPDPYAETGDGTAIQFVPETRAEEGSFISEPYSEPETPQAVTSDAATPSAGETYQLPESFTQPSAPMPPVKAEGTVMPGRSGGMPPMLGEGMFGK